MNVIKGGVTKPKGFKANGIWCGIKRSRKPDLGLIYSEIPAVTAGVFTQNSIKAAPLVVSQKHIQNNKTQAVIVNSGNANCFTGSFGLLYAEKTTQLIGKLLEIPKKDVIVASTGIIGKPLPFKKIEKAAQKLVDGLGKTKANQTAKSILTTDLKTKECAVTISLGGKKVTIGACAKGSGMIAPNMATMLAFVSTDCNISAKMLKSALSFSNENSFNCISVDGCMSTNDMVTVMANGLAENKKITTKDKNFIKFRDALHYVCVDLAKKIVLDGEGATKFIMINVKGGETSAQAKKVAMAVANSNLVKTAAYASDPNWGRVVAAVGSVGIKKVSEKKLKIKFSSFKNKNIGIFIDLGIGKEHGVAFTSDLSHEYVRINGEYN